MKFILLTSLCTFMFAGIVSAESTRICARSFAGFVKAQEKAINKAYDLRASRDIKKTFRMDQTSTVQVIAEDNDDPQLLWEVCYLVSDAPDNIPDGAHCYDYVLFNLGVHLDHVSHRELKSMTVGQTMPIRLQFYLAPSHYDGGNLLYPKMCQIPNYEGESGLSFGDNKKSVCGHSTGSSDKAIKSAEENLIKNYRGINAFKAHEPVTVDLSFGLQRSSFYESEWLYGLRRTPAPLPTWELCFSPAERI